MKNIISSYINNLRIDQVESFARNNNVSLSKEELNFVYSFIKKNGLTLIDNPDSLNINSYRNKFSNENFNKINNLIQKYRLKYKSLL